MVRMIIRGNLAADLQPAAHHLDLVRLGKRHSQAELSHVVALSVPGQQIRHINGLKMVVNHALHELDIGFGRLDFGEIRRLLDGNYMAWSTRGTRLNKKRLRLNWRSSGGPGVAGSLSKRNRDNNGGDGN